MGKPLIDSAFFLSLQFHMPFGETVFDLTIRSFVLLKDRYFNSTFGEIACCYGTGYGATDNGNKVRGMKLHK